MNYLLASTHFVGPILAGVTGHSALGWFALALTGVAVLGLPLLLFGANSNGDRQAELTFEELRREDAPLRAWRPVETTRTPIGGPIDGDLTVDQFDAMWDASLWGVRQP